MVHQCVIKLVMWLLPQSNFHQKGPEISVGIISSRPLLRIIRSVI